MDVCRENTDVRWVGIHLHQIVLYLFHGHPSPEDDSHGEVPAVPRVAGCHHVLRFKHLKTFKGKLDSMYGGYTLDCSSVANGIILTPFNNSNPKPWFH